MTPLKLVLGRLEGVRRVGAGYVAHCPAHPDKTPSLGIDEGEDGRVLLVCRAGCDTADVLAAMKLEPADLFARRNGGGDGFQIVDAYPYHGADGEVLFEVVRYISNAKPKGFYQRHPDGHGGWAKGRGDAPRVLFNLPKVLEAVAGGWRVWVVEGEKDALALGRAGEVATCNPEGAGKWKAEYAEVLRGTDVLIVPDQDGPGTKHAADVEASLVGVAASVTILRPAVGKDASDHFGAGYGVEDFVQDLAGDHLEDPHAGPVEIFVDWQAFWDRDRREADWVFEDVLARGRGHAIFAGHKVGKSLLVLSMVVWLVQHGVVVVYLDYEMGEDDLYDRLADMGYGPETDLSRLHYAILPSLPPLDGAEGAKALFALVDGVAAAHPGDHVAVIIDTTGRAVAGEENSADTFRNFYRHTGLGLKQRGLTWARLDHAGKDAAKGQRGSSSKGDDVDVVWRLVRTDSGLELKREASRMGWVPERVAFRKMENPLRFVRIAEDWPAGTKEVADLLDDLGVPPGVGERPAGQTFRAAGHTATQSVLRAALKWRRQAAQGAGK